MLSCILLLTNSILLCLLYKGSLLAFLYMLFALNKVCRGKGPQLLLLFQSWAQGQ